MKQLGIPTTLGEFRKITEQYPDETLLQFRNEPRHELIDDEGELCFQEIADIFETSNSRFEEIVN